MDYDKEFKAKYLEAMALIGGKGERMQQIVSEIKSLEELLTLQAIEYEL